MVYTKLSQRCKGSQQRREGYVVSMFAQRWPIIKSTLAQRLVFAGLIHSIVEKKLFRCSGLSSVFVIHKTVRIEVASRRAL